MPNRDREVEVHVHVHSDGADLAPVLQKLTYMEAQLSALSEAVAGVSERVNADIDHLKDLLEQALATETSNEAEIARLREEAATVGADTQAAVDALNAIDPDPDFPAPPEEPPVEPPVE